MPACKVPYNSARKGRANVLHQLGAPIATEPESLGATHPTILVVDDERAVRTMLRTMLEAQPQSYRVLEAASASEALAVARSESVDLVLLDVGLPDADGFHVCRMLRADPKTAAVTIIMVTAMSLARDRDTAQRAGADDYVVKPFSPRALLNLLSERLATRA